MADAKYRKSCDSCLNSKIKCSQDMPSCSRCVRQGKECVYSQYRKIGRPAKGSSPSPNSHSPQYLKKLQSTTLPVLPRPTTINPPLYPLKYTNDFSGSGWTKFNQESTHAQEFSSEACTDATMALAWDWNDARLNQESNGTRDTAEPVGLYANSSFDLWKSSSAQTGSNFQSGSSAASTHTAMRPNHLEDSMQGSDSNWYTNSYIFGADLRSSSSCCSEDSLPVTNFSSHPRSVQGQHLARTVSSRSVPIRDHFSAHMASQDSSYMRFFEHDVGRDNPQRRSSVPQNTFSNRSKNVMPAATTEGWCTRNCYANLTKQHGYLCRLIDSDHDIPLESFLKLNEHIIEERERALQCPSCLGLPGTRLTLTLAIRIFERVMTLFERRCRIEYRPLDKPTSSESNSLSHSEYRPTNMITEEYMARKGESSDKMLRAHLETQTETMLQLNRALATGAKDINYEENYAILVGASKRLEHLKGVVFMAYVE